MSAATSFADANYERLSIDAVRQLHANFLERIEKEAKKAVPKDLEKPQDLIEALKELLIEAARLRVAHTAIDLSEIAAQGRETIVARTEQLRNPPDPFPEQLRRAITDAAAKRTEPPEVQKLFGEAERIYLRLNSFEQSETQKRVAAHLQEKGYIVTDYGKGYATDEKGKQQFKIGKLLKDNEQLYSAFMNDSTRTLDRTLVVISRNIEDIARMSTNRGWRSCMGADGMYRDFVPRDIENGTLIAYLISERDPEVNDPLARLLIKPYRRYSEEDALLQKYESNNYSCFHPIRAAFGRAAIKTKRLLFGNEEVEEGQVYVPMKTQYGLKSEPFSLAVRQFVAETLNADKKDGLYMIDMSMYADGTPRNLKKEGKDLNPGLS